MRTGAAILSLFLAAFAAQNIVSDVRLAIAQKNLTLGDNLIGRYKAVQGVTPEMIEAVSWLGRGALELQRPDRAEAYAAQARDLALAQLSRRQLDAEPHLPLALAPAIQVHAH